MTVEENLEKIVIFITYVLFSFFIYYCATILMISNDDNLENKYPHAYAISQFNNEIHKNDKKLFLYHFLGSTAVAMIIGVSKLTKLAVFPDSLHTGVFWFLSLFFMISFPTTLKIFELVPIKFSKFRRNIIFSLNMFWLACTWVTSWVIIDANKKEIKKFVKKILQIISITSQTHE